MIPDFSSSLSLFVHYWTIAKLKRDYEKKEMEKRGKEETSCCPLGRGLLQSFLCHKSLLFPSSFSLFAFFFVHILALIVETGLPLSLSRSLFFSPPPLSFA